MPSTKKPTESPLAFPHKDSMGTTKPLLAVGNIPEVVEPLQGYKQIKADHEFEGLLPGELLGWCGEPMAPIQEPSTGLSDWERLPEGTAEAPLLDSNTNLP